MNTIPKTVIIIDPEGFDSMIIKAVLNSTEFHVIAECKNGKLGVTKAIEFQPDFIFLDEEIKEHNVIEVVKELNNLDLKTTIIIMGNEDLTELKTYFSQFNIHHFLQKPFSRNIILELLQNSLP